MNIYFSGLSVGLILLQTAIVAPTLAKTLSREAFGVSIRVIWPKFFLLLAGSGVGSLTALLASENRPFLVLSIAVATVLLPLICYGLIPATNRATDTGNTALFKKLHLLSVLFTVVVLLANMGVMFV